MTRFLKYHGHGNEYIVFDVADWGEELDDDLIRSACRRDTGPGADGVLLGPLPATEADFALRIFNPDASEAEKSGNGLCIFARYLRDSGRVSTDSFTVRTVGGLVTSRVHEDPCRITLDIGRAAVGEALELTCAGERLTVLPVDLGNPHAVVPRDAVSETDCRRLGPAVSTHPAFPAGTNVQFIELVDRAAIRMQVWERGAGYTPASGSSASAAAAAMYVRGLVDEEVTVRTPGGETPIAIGADMAIRMTGRVEYVLEGRL